MLGGGKNREHSSLLLNTYNGGGKDREHSSLLLKESRVKLAPTEYTYTNTQELINENLI